MPLHLEAHRLNEMALPFRHSFTQTGRTIHKYAAGSCVPTAKSKYELAGVAVQAVKSEGCSGVEQRVAVEANQIGTLANDPLCVSVLDRVPVGAMT